MTKDEYFLLDNITTELVAIVMENEHLDMQDAMSRVLNSQTYEKIQDPRTGLLSQSPLYIYDVLKSRG